MVMSKYLFAAVVGTLLLAGCSSKESERKAFEAGCSQGIVDVLSSLGAGPNQPVIDEHCKQAAEEYLKGAKK
jgi:hypothetical protein